MTDDRATDDHGSAGLDVAALEALAGQICARAAQQAQATCRLLELIGEFDAQGGLGYLRGVKSVAHWLSWSCSMSPGVAREHVRVARALRRMPTVTAAFREGQLSYSKVREVTRLVDHLDEVRLCDLARAATASQLARAITGFRAAAGSRVGRHESRRLAIRAGDDGHLCTVIGRYPVDETAIISAALRAARDRNAPPPPPGGRYEDTAADRGTPAYTDADALLDVCQHYLATATVEDDSGEDRTLIVVEVAAEQLIRIQDTDTAAPAQTPNPVEGVPAGTSVAGDQPPPDSHPDPAPRVPAGTRGGIPRNQVCTVRGLGGIEPATAARLACTGTLLGAILDAHGDVLALGRSRRLVSKTQRRALMLRDQMCQFPGCARSRHLEAHHTIPWSRGGRTDLDDLVLLCRFHHLTVHEGGIAITRQALDDEHAFVGARTGSTAWRFTLPDGAVLSRTGPYIPTADALIRRLTTEPAADVDHIRSLADRETRTIRPDQTGERFDLHATVHALFGMVVPPPDTQAA